MNPQGKLVTGALSADKSSWHSTEVLGYSKTYRLSASAADSSGESTQTLTRKFSTVTPRNMTMPYLDDIYGTPLHNGGTYGIAMVPVVHFDEVVSDRKAAEAALHGDDLAEGGRVLVLGDAAGRALAPAQLLHAGNEGHGFGRRLRRERRWRHVRPVGRVGVVQDRPQAGHHRLRHRSQVGQQDQDLPQRQAGPHDEHLDGRARGEEVNGSWINFYTLDGTYTVLGLENPAHMCSATYGLPANAAGGYPCEDIPWSTKISTDGIYLHELDTTIWAQDNGRTSRTAV